MNSERAFENAAVCYARVSTEEQVRGGVSLDAQEERLRSYCSAAGLELVQFVFEPGVSGSKSLASRPGGQKLLELIEDRKVNAVVALKLDRLFRDASDALTQTRSWDRGGIALHLLDMGGQAINTHSALGRMMLTMMAAFAELERNLISERTASALAHKKSRLRVYGPVPFGFAREANSLRVIGTEQLTIHRMRSLRDAGWSYRAIADSLNEEGVDTKQGGGRWYATTVRKIILNDLHQGVPKAA